MLQLSAEEIKILLDCYSKVIMRGVSFYKYLFSHYGINEQTLHIAHSNAMSVLEQKIDDIYAKHKALSGLSQWIPISTRLEQKMLDFINYQNWLKKQMCFVFGIPEELLN